MHSYVITVSDLSMQSQEGDVKTMPAPSYIPLDGSQGQCQSSVPRYISRLHRQNSNNYYNRTKRKRDSSSSSGGNGNSLGNRGGGGGGVDPTGGTANLPPWSDPLYPYSRGTLG